MHAPSKFSSTKKDSDKEKKVKHHEASRSDSLVNETALPGACWNNDFALVKSIIAKDSCNVNFLNERTQTGLYCAARQGHSDIMIELVNHKNINPNVICAQGSTALHAACFGGHPEAVAILLMSGSDPEIKSSLGLIPKQESKMSVIIDLFKTFESNPEDLKLDFPILKKINMRNEKLKAVVAHKLGKNQNQHPTAFPKMTKSVVDMVLMNQPVKPDTAETLLSKLSRKEQLLVERLSFESNYQSFQCQVSFDDNEIENPSLACLQVEIKDHFLFIYLDPEQLKATQFDAWRRFSSLYREDELSDLTEKICEAINENNEAALASALLLPFAFVAINQRGSEGKSPLIQAIIKNNPRIVLALLNHGSLQVNQQDEKTGDTALHVAARNNYATLVALLLYAHANANVSNLKGESARDLINKQPATSKTREVLRLVDENKLLLTEMMKENYPILNELHPHEIQFQMPMVSVATEEEKKSVFDRLNDYCVNGKVADLQSLLAQSESVVEKVINRVNDRGQTPLYIASRQGHTEIVKILLDIENINKEYQVIPHKGTALHAASFNGYGTIVALLLFAGADCTVINAQGLTPKQEAKGDSIEAYYLFQNNLPLFKSTYNVTQPTHLHSSGKSVKKPLVIKHDDPTILKFKFNIPTIKEYNLNIQKQSISIKFFDFRYIRIVLPELVDYVVISAIIEKNKQIFLHERRGEQIPFTTQTFIGEKKEDLFVYDPVSYYTRLGFTVREDLQFSHWVIMPFENHHSLVILETLPEQDVSLIQKFHYQGGIPVLSWSTQSNGKLLRCQRPLTCIGTTGPLLPLHENDPYLKQQIFASLNYMEDLNMVNNSNSPITIIDCGKMNLDLTSMHKSRREMKFLEISSIAILEQFENLHAYNYEMINKSEFPTKDNKIDNSAWRDMVGIILRHTQMIQKKILKNQCVIIQGAGPDYRCVDSILSCLVQISLDPHFRKIEGFLQLLRKDWFLEGVLPWENPSGSTKSVVNNPFPGLYYNQAHSVMFINSNRNAVRPAQGSQSNQPPPRPKNEAPLCSIDHGSSFPFFLLLISCIQELKNYFPVSFEWRDSFLSDVLAEYHFHALEPVYETKFSDKTMLEIFTKEFTLRQQDSSINDPQPLTLSSIEWARKSNEYFPRVNHYFDVLISRLRRYPALYFENPEQALDPAHEQDPNDRELKFDDFLYDKSRSTSEYSPFVVNKQLYRAFEILDGPRKESHKLEISVSRIFRLPDIVMPYFQDLTHLALSCNLSALPKSFSQMQQIQTLVLSRNRFSSFPTVLLAFARSLTSLDLSDNVLQVIPPTITQLTNLQLLNLESNKLKEFNLPMDEASALLSARIHRNHGSVISSVAPLVSAGQQSPSGTSPSSKPQLLGASKNIEQLQAGMQMARHKSTNLKRVSAQDREAIRIDTKSLGGTHVRAEGLSKLKKLIIAFNNITTIPNFLSLSSLEYLAVNNNPLTQLPDRFIASITNCTHLDASSSSLRLLSSSWNNLANLTSLNLSLNRISELPPSIVDCVNLKQLFLENNKFRNFPHPIKYLLNLEILNLSHNEIKFVPFWIGKLTKMKRLLLRGNQIILVSIAISSLENLLTLDLRDNYLNAIPHSVVLLKKLETLNVNGNPNLKKFENMKFSDVKTCLRELKKEEDAQLVKLQKANIMFLSPSNVANQDALFAKVFDTKAFKLIPAVESAGLTDITSDNLKFQSLIYQDPKKGNEEIRTEVCLLKDVRILEGIFPIFIRDEFTFVLSLDLALAREVLISQIRYWCLNLVTRIRKPRVLFVFFGIEEWKKKNPGHSKTAVAEACNSIFDECQKDKVFQKVKNPQHFHCDDHFREAGLEQVRNALIAAVLDSPKKEFKLKYMKFITMLEELSIEKLKRNEHPVLTHEDFIFMANTVGIQKIIEIEEIKGILDSNLSIIMKYLGQSDIDGIIVINPKWLGHLFAKFLTSTDMIAQFLFVNGIFASYEMQNLLFNFYETSRPFLLFLLDRFDLVVTLQRKKQLPNLLTMRKNTQLNVGFYGTLQKHSELEVDIYFYLKGALPESPNKDSTQLSLKRLREEHPNEIVLQRVVKMNFFSSDLFAMIVGKVLDIVMVENPRESLEAWNNTEKGISCVTIKLHQAEIVMRRTTVPLKKSEKNFAYHLSLLVIGEAEFSVDAFSTICSAFYDCMYDTKIDFKSFLVLESEELVDVVEFEKHLEDALNDIEYRGEKLNLFQQIPEKFLPFFKGNRYSMAHFDKKKLLGKGGFAEVFLSAHKESGVEYAIKELIMNGKDKSAKKYYSTFKEFSHEIEIQGALNHPNILKMIGIIIKPFGIVTEFCAYGDLYGFLTNWEKPFPNALRVKFTRDLASALQYLQDLDPPIAHIDFKSPNIFLFSLEPESPVCAKVADFGTSHRISAPITIRYVDNATWLAPEVLSGEPYDQMVDTYALGAVVWEMVARKRYLSDIHELDIVDTIISGERPAIPSFCLPQISTVITSCWENNPANRASMSSVLNVLDQITKADIAQYDALCAVYDQELKAQWEQEALEREQAKKEKDEKEKDELSQSKSTKKSKRDFVASGGMPNDSGGGSMPSTPHASTGLPLTPSCPSPMTGSTNALTNSNPNVPLPSSSSGASPVVPSRPGASLPAQNPVRPARSPTLEWTGTGSESAKSSSGGRDEKKEKKAEVKAEKSVKKTSLGQSSKPTGPETTSKPQEKQAWFSDFTQRVDAEFSKEVQSEFDKIMKETQAKINDPYGL